MARIVEDLLVSEKQLSEFPSTAHWFCPKRNDEDIHNYNFPELDEPDLSSELKKKYLKEAEDRQNVAYQCSVVFGFSVDDEQVRDFQNKYFLRLTALLTTCDRCVRNYHKGRKRFLRQFSEEFDDEIVTALSERIEQFDFLRIDQGLERAIDTLKKVPDSQKSISALAAAELAGLTGLYEALCYPAYHKSRGKLTYPLGEAMKLVQTGKRLRLSDLVPSTTRFLFDEDHNRYQFAVLGWRKAEQTINTDEFEWVIQDALIDAIQDVCTLTAIPNIQQFWDGLILILRKLDHEIITHSLSGMEVQPDIYHLLLSHLTCNSEDVLCAVLEVLQILLTKAPKAFWAAYGAISPVTIAEQIVNSPSFGRLLAQHPASESDTPTVVAWIPVFMRSLSIAQQHDTCRFLVSHLIDNLEIESVSRAAQLVRRKAALDALLSMLTAYNEGNHDINSSTSFIIVNDILRLVGTYKHDIMRFITQSPNMAGESLLYQSSLAILQNSLTINCGALKHEFRALQNGQPVDHGLESYSSPLWHTILDSFKRDDVTLATHILVGITSLIGLEPFRAKTIRGRGKQRLSEEPLTPGKASFNRELMTLTKSIAQIFERLSDFSPEKLGLLCVSRASARPMLAALTSADTDVNEAAVQVIKAVTGEIGRKEAVAGLLKGTFEPTLDSLAFAAREINIFRTFSAVPNVLKIGRDVLDSLCDPQDGVLRTKTSLTSKERRAILSWWAEQWKTLDGAFLMTEEWSSMYSTTILTNFCRDTMEFAEALFDQCDLLANVVDTGEKVDFDDQSDLSTSTSHRRKLLENPRGAVNSLRQWLRLKDEHLARTVVSLLTKLLRRLGKAEMEIDEVSFQYIEAVATTPSGLGDRNKGDARIYTILSQQQKAELLNALDDHLGIESGSASISVLSKEKQQSNLNSWARTGQNLPFGSQVGSRPVVRQGVIDVDTWRSKSMAVESRTPHDSHYFSKTADDQTSLLNEFRAKHQPPKSGNKAQPLFKTNPGESIGQARQREKEAQRQKALAFAQSKHSSSIVAGEGSGLRGLRGVIGKDHALPKGEMMVSSSEDSSSGDEKVINIIRKDRLKEEPLRQNRKLHEPQGPVRKTKIVRSAKDMRARLTPPMDMLHHTILKWEIFYESDTPPDAPAFKEIANEFFSPDEYANTFYPLLISEAWRTFSTDKDDNNSKPFELKVVNRMSVDQFYEVSTSMPSASSRDLKIMEGDIILLSKGQDPINDEKAPHCLARVLRITRKKESLEASYRVSSFAVNRTGLLTHLAPNSKIKGYKITSMTTIEREFAALKSLQYYDLCQEILEAKPSPILSYSERVLDPIRRNYGVNLGQAKAVWSAKENDAFTLIQGPPGSGKTKTIIAMVGALLTDSFSKQGVAIDRPGASESNVKILSKKLLVCAPSNAAVDELVSRLKGGVKTLRGDFHKINVVRLGRTDAVKSDVKDVTLDELVRTKLEGDSSNGNNNLTETAKLHQEAGLLKEKLVELRLQMEEARTKGDNVLEQRLQREFDAKKRDQARIGAKIDANKDSGNTAARDNEIQRRRVQQEIINSAHVICSTLSGSGHDMFKSLQVEFETVIIDEAAQSIELSALIPLKYGCSKCILVGDPKQLPPTVLSRSAAEYGYEQSLFVRMQRNSPGNVHLLDTQYRMHPAISMFPSQEFYDGRLINGPNMAAARLKPWHAASLLGPYRFFDVKGSQTVQTHSHSFVNNEEIKVALQLFERLRTDFTSYDLRGKVGIITPYKAQLRELRSKFAARYGETIYDEIDFNTADSFQGRESEIIIFSCVRARATGGVGFLSDIRRMNVGLTRAKSSLWVLGDSRALMQGEFWAKLILDARRRELYTEGDIWTLLRKPSQIQASNPTQLTEFHQPSKAQDGNQKLVELNEYGEENFPDAMDGIEYSNTSIKSDVNDRCGRTDSVTDTARSIDNGVLPTHTSTKGLNGVPVSKAGTDADSHPRSVAPSQKSILGGGKARSANVTAEGPKQSKNGSNLISAPRLVPPTVLGQPRVVKRRPPADPLRRNIVPSRPT